MPIEQRVVAGGRPQVSAPRPTAAAKKTEAAPADSPSPKRSKKGLMITLIALVVAGAVGAAAWFFVLAPSGEDDAEPEGPIAGEVYTIESMNINLAEGRYLRVGFGLQFIEGADVDHFDPAKARNAAIEVYSGQSFSDIMDPVTREALRVQYAGHLDELYEGEVMDVYLTDYVAQ